MNGSADHELNRRQTDDEAMQIRHELELKVAEMKALQQRMRDCCTVRVSRLTGLTELEMQ